MSFSTHTPIQYIPGIGWRTAKVMHQLGIHTAGQLQNMPESVLVELFGPSIQSVIDTVTPNHDDQFLAQSKGAVNSKIMKEWAGAIADDKLSWMSRFRLAAQFVSHLQ